MDEIFKTLLPRLKRKRATLNKREDLIGRTWVLILAEAEPLEFTFARDGTLYKATRGGHTSKGTWRLLSDSNQLVIEFSDESFILRPLFIDQTAMLLSSYGGNLFAFVGSEWTKNLRLDLYLKYVEEKLGIQDDTDPMPNDRITKDENQKEQDAAVILISAFVFLVLCFILYYFR